MSSVTPDRFEVRKLYCAIEFSVIETSKFVTIKVESHSQSPDDPSLVCDWGAGIDTRCRLCTHYSDYLYHIHHFHSAATEDMVKFS